MDRKNKKAAQAAAAAATAAEKGIMGPKDGSKDAAARGTAARKRDGHLSTSIAGHTGPHGNSSAAHGGSGRNALLTGGSTAPTRILSSSSTSTPSTRPPINMPLKAPISPSAPAPSLKDTDFASFAAIDEMEGVDLPAPQGQGKTDHETKEEQEHGNPPSDAGTNDLARVADIGQPRRESQPPSPVPLPTSAPRPSAPPATTNFGPIGSPPSATRANGLLASRKVPGTISPGTSPRSNSGAFLHPNINQGIYIVLIACVIAKDILCRDLAISSLREQHRSSAFLTIVPLLCTRNAVGLFIQLAEHTWRCWRQPWFHERCVRQRQ